jgi:hypothetical protein
MSEKVNKSYFVQSEVLDAHLVATEDLYARYFERGSHKVAVGKLRSKSGKSTEYYGSVYRNGLLLGAGLVFGIQGLVSGAVKLSDPDVVVRVNTSYLLQVHTASSHRQFFHILNNYHLDLRWAIPFGTTFPILCCQLQDLGRGKNQLCLHI